MLYKRLIWLIKISFPDSPGHVWPEKLIEARGAMQSAQKQPMKMKKVTIFWKNIHPGQYQPYGPKKSSQWLLWKWPIIKLCHHLSAIFCIFDFNICLMVAVIRNLKFTISSSLKCCRYADIMIYIFEWSQLKIMRHMENLTSLSIDEQLG